MDARTGKFAAAISFAATIFLSAFLLFLIQPLVSKQILPLYGGSPAVWTTCLLFFQALLLAGYAYAHGSNHRLRPRGQAMAHVVLLAAACLIVLIAGVLPSSRPAAPSGGLRPIRQILAMLTLSVGLPYFVLAATAPLLQAWFGRLFPDRTPYRLYALSNTGSLLALLSYPFVLEPLFTLPQQARMWIGGFIAFVIVGTIAARHVWSANDCQTHLAPMDEQAQRPTAQQYIAWLLWPAIACVALFSTTNHVSTDLAAAPFLWVVPLALYLVTFIIAFDHPRWYKPVAIAVPTVAAIYVAALAHKEGLGTIEFADIGTPGRLYELVLHGSSNNGAELPSDKSLEFRIGPRTFLALNFTALFGISMVCHGELVRRRPHTRYLTSFYLMIATGGVLGGFFTAVVAPILFSTYFEWRLSLFGGCLIAIGVVLRALVGRAFDDEAAGPAIGRYFLLPLVAMPLFVLAAIVLLDLTEFLQPRDGGVLFRQRNFFGAISVRERDAASPAQHNLVLQHGAITHGTQFTLPSRRREPTTYFSHQSGVGRTFEFFERAPPAGGLNIGVIGLGTGTLAAYAEAADSITFYEINPAVVDVATDPRWFTYLRDCRNRGGQVAIRLGDARLTLAREVRNNRPDGFHLLVLDAFSGDSIPMHLLTAEAFEIYRAALHENGAIAVHISNRFLDLAPVVRAAADHLAFSAVHIRNNRDRSRSIYSADWIILSRNETLILALSQYADTRGKPARQNILWTDKRSSLLDVLK